MSAAVIKDIQKHHKKSKSWDKTARYFNELYKVDLSKASYQDWGVNGKEPASAAVRAAFGLGPRICPTCLQRVTVPRKVRTYRNLIDLSKDDLIFLLENREVMV